MRKIAGMSVVASMIACAMLSGQIAAAQDVDDFEGSRVWDLELLGSAVDGGLSYRSEADIDEGGDFSVIGLRVNGSTIIGMTDEVRLDAGAGYELNSYDFSGVGANSWDEIHTLRFRALFNYAYDEVWNIMGGPLFSLSGESGADLDKSFAGGAVAGATYKMGEKNAIGLAVGAMSQIEDDARFFAFPLVRWHFAEPWSAHVGFTTAGSSGGPGAEVAYDMSEEWRFAGGLQLQQRRFRLDKDDAVGEDTSVPVYVKATYKISPECSADFVVGVSAGGELRVEDEDGHKVYESDYDPAAMLGARLALLF